MHIFQSGKISRGGKDIPWQATSKLFWRRACGCFHRYCNRKELGLTELLANLVVSKKIKGLLFVHSKVLGI